MDYRIYRDEEKLIDIRLPNKLPITRLYSMRIVIDSGSGFCFGVRRAIATLEQELHKHGEVYCVGDIVHNEQEIERLQGLGLKIIENSELNTLHSTNVLFRAHGEPPSSYAIVEENELKLTDATCPVVLKLQQSIRQAWLQQKSVNGQVVLFGKKGHAEVIGLMGQTENECILVEDESQINKIDPERPCVVFAQTTKDPQQYRKLLQKIRQYTHAKMEAHNSICRQMADRAENLKTFALQHDVILFVGGTKSSNSRVLFDICNAINPDSHFLTSESEVDMEWFNPRPNSIGIFGATSTPLWLMERVRASCVEMLK